MCCLSIPVELPWIPTLKVNGAPGNIKGGLDRYAYLCLNHHLLPQAHTQIIRTIWLFKQNECDLCKVPFICHYYENKLLVNTIRYLHGFKTLFLHMLLLTIGVLGRRRHRQSWGRDNNEMYRKTYNIRRTKSHNLDVSRLILQLSLPNPLRPGVKSRMR